MKNKKLILFLTLAGILIMALPLFIFGVHKSFYVNPDPDLVYATNAVLFLKSGIISYVDHPGTPQILLTSLLSLPLRFMSTSILHQNFTQWTFNNFEIYTFYLRVFELIISGLSLYILLRLVNKTSNSKTPIIIFFLIFFSTGVFTWSINIAPEPLLIFLSAIWLYYLFKFLAKTNLKYSIVLSGLSGLAFATKFTGLALPIFTLILIALGNKDKIKTLSINAAIFVAAFIAGIVPVIPRIKDITGWGASLFFHPGIYGQGPKTIFQINTYVSSLLSLIKDNPIVFFVIIFGAVVLFLCRQKIKSKKDRILLWLFVISLILFFIFSKYPKIHYNYVNILLMAFSISYFVSKVSKIWKTIIILTLTFLFVLELIINTVNLVNTKVIAGGVENGYMHYALKEWTPFWSGNVYKDFINQQ